MIRIHKAGWQIIATITILLTVINVTTILLIDLECIWITLLILSSLLLIFVLRFFRKPIRIAVEDESLLIAPCDGKVVVIEETQDDEVAPGKYMQVSVFMSVWNVHINWIPINGILKYFKYHPGKFLLAIEPKSSTLNERTTLMIERPNGDKILIRQIAGFVARRIETYTTQSDMQVTKGQQLGFIKFGSRVDILLPLNSEILVKIGQKTKGCLTPIARLK